MSLSYTNLLFETKVIADKYSLGNLLKGFTPDLINLLAENHIEKIKRADSYESSESLINASLSSQLGAPVAFADFITSDADRHKLYSLFAQWRSQLLADLHIQI